MKKINLILAVSFLVIGFGCSKEQDLQGVQMKKSGENPATYELGDCECYVPPGGDPMDNADEWVDKYGVLHTYPECKKCSDHEPE